MKIAATYPDVEHLVVDWLTAELDEDCTIGVGVPGDWTKESGNHLQVDLDGTPRLDHPVLAHATVRMVAHSASTTESKRLAMKAQGILLAHPGGDGVAGTRALTGVFPAHDSTTGAELASVTTRVTVRSALIEPSGS